VRDKGIAKQFQRTKNVAEKKRTKGVAPTGILRSLAAVRRRTVTDLLGEVWAYTITLLFTLYVIYLVY